MGQYTQQCTCTWPGLMSEVEQIDQLEAKGRDPLVLLYEVRCHYRSCPRYQCVCACACCDIGVLYAHMLFVRYQMLSFVYNIYVVSSVHIYLFVVMMTIAVLTHHCYW